MKLIIFRQFTFLIPLLFSSGAAFASCDECAKAALQAASNSMTSSISATKSVVETNGTAIETLSSSIDTAGSTIQSLLDLNSQQELTALSGVANRITFTLERQAEESTRITDHLVQSIHQIHKDGALVSSRIENDKLFGPLAQTISGDINSARAQYLAKGIGNKKALKELHAQNMDKWLNSAGYRNSSQFESEILLKDEEIWKSSPLINKRRLTDEEVNKAQILLQLLVDDNPTGAISKERIKQDPLAAKMEVQRLKNNFSSQIVHSVLSDYLSNKAALIPTDKSWLKSYFKIEPDEKGNISFEQFYESETMGRLISDDWFLDIKTRTEAGLLREQIYQMNTSNMLLSEIIKQERMETKLMAISALRGMQ